MRFVPEEWALVALSVLVVLMFILAGCTQPESRYVECRNECSRGVDTMRGSGVEVEIEECQFVCRRKQEWSF